MTVAHCSRLFVHLNEYRLGILLLLLSKYQASCSRQSSVGIPSRGEAIIIKYLGDAVCCRAVFETSRDVGVIITVYAGISIKTSSPVFSGLSGKMSTAFETIN